MRSMPAQFARALTEACRAHPEQRTCQVIVNALGTDPFHMEDEAAIAKLREYAEMGYGNPDA